MKRFRRLCALLLLLLLTACPALAEGFRFRLTAALPASGWSGEHQELMQGLSALLEVAALEGTLAAGAEGFTLDANLLLGSGRDQCSTNFQLYGLDSHWGLRSSLLGDEELMINCASLLPFGLKAREYLGLPLDKAALLIPYTHQDALCCLWEVLSPLFPQEDGSFSVSRSEMDDVVRELMRLCDEDAALNRYLETTGLYRYALRYAQLYFSVPSQILSGMTVTRRGDVLTWRAWPLTLLRLETTDVRTEFSFEIPFVLSAEAEMLRDEDVCTAKVTVDSDFLTGTLSTSFPVRLTHAPSEISLQVDASSDLFPDGRLQLAALGTLCEGSVSLHLTDPASGRTLMSIQGSVTSCTPATEPSWRPEDLKGVNVLSVNSDTLPALLHRVRWPLMQGLFDLVVAAPAPSVQALMDYAEDSGLIGMLTDMLSGGSGY